MRRRKFITLLGDLDIVQRLCKHGFINAEGARDQGMRAMAYQRMPVRASA